MENTTYTRIEKESISTLSFKKELELDQNFDLIDRLKKASVLGNIHHSKVIIYFLDDDCPKKVETTIWAVGSQFICLKGGVWIPISNIVDIEF